MLDSEGKKAAQVWAETCAEIEGNLRRNWSKPALL